MSSAPVIRIRAKVPTWTPFERLRKVRRESGLNQNAFAAKLGVKPSTLGAWETGRNPIPDVLTLSETIEREFGYSKYWFRGDLDGAGYDGDPGPDGGIASDLAEKLRIDNSRGNVVTVDFERSHVRELAAAS